VLALDRAKTTYTCAAKDEDGPAGCVRRERAGARSMIWGGEGPIECGQSCFDATPGSKLNSQPGRPAAAAGSGSAATMRARCELASPAVKAAWTAPMRPSCDNLAR